MSSNYQTNYQKTSGQSEKQFVDVTAPFQVVCMQNIAESGCKSVLMTKVSNNRQNNKGEF